MEAPTDVEVRQARTSNDGNTVAWLDNDGQLGLASAGKTQWTFPVTPQATLFDAQAAQALYWDEGGLHLRTGDLDIPLPTDGRPDWAMIARDVVQVAYEDESVFFRVRGSRDPIQRPGGELISPDAQLTFGVDGVVRTLAGQEQGPVTGRGPIAKALWLDHDTFVVATGPQGGATKASVCEAATLTCEPLRLATAPWSCRPHPDRRSTSCSRWRGRRRCARGHPGRMWSSVTCRRWRVAVRQACACCCGQRCLRNRVAQGRTAPDLISRAEIWQDTQVAPAGSPGCEHL